METDSEEAIKSSLDWMMFLFGGTYSEPEQRNKLGSGTYGEVFAATSKDSTVAVKEVDHSELVVLRRTIREVRLLRLFGSSLGRDSTFVVPLLDVYASRSKCRIVMPKYDMDLFDAIEQGVFGPDNYVQPLYQLVCALNYIHSGMVAHRDLKPENVLVDTERNSVTIADFGLAHDLVHAPGGCIGTDSYCPPEQFPPFGPCDLTQAMDMWGLGCVMFQMLTRDRFVHADENDTNATLRTMVGKLGSPALAGTVYDTPAGRKLFASFSDVTLTPLEESVPALSETALDLLSKLLVWDPTARLTAAQALKHPLFVQFHTGKEPTMSEEEQEQLHSGFAKIESKNERDELLQCLTEEVGDKVAANMGSWLPTSIRSTWS